MNVGSPRLHQADARGAVSGLVTVVGSANLDIVASVSRLPGPGETVLATAVQRVPGGKGNNQAIASARAGAPTAFVAAVGTDQAAEVILDALVGANVEVTTVERVDGATGTAYITVDSSAENSIVVDPGANAALRTLSEGALASIRASAYVLAQLEVPLDTVIAAARATADSDALFVLNAAPATTLPAELLSATDILVVNETEAVELARLAPGADVVEAIDVLSAMVPTLVVTLGSAGVIVARGRDALIRLPARSVTAVDTTGAGDTFCGALTASLASGSSLREAADFATAAASIAVQRSGAVPSIPLLPEIEAVLAGA